MGSQVNFYDLISKALGTGMLVGGNDTLAVLMYQVGEISKCQVYAEVAINAEDIVSARLYDRLLEPALADTLLQLQLIAHAYGLDFNALIEDGVERFKQRIRDRGGDA